MKKILISSMILSLLMLWQLSPAQLHEDVLLNLRQKFEKYCLSVPREEIFVQTDRNKYIAGEEMWFNIFLFDRQSSELSSGSSIAYLELLNSDNKPVVQKRFRLYSGTGPGQVILPDSLSSGMYTLRVYTNWMKNFLPDNCFMKEIIIYNAFNIKTFNRKIYDKDIRNETAVPAGKTSGPVPGLKISFTRSEQAATEITIDAEENYRSENGDVFFLFVQTHGKIDRSSSEKLTGKNTKITIPDSTLSPGINQISIFNSKGKILSEKLNYTPGIVKSQDLAIDCPDSFRTRSRIRINIPVPQAGKKPVISVSVSPVINNSVLPLFDDYLVFGSEFGPQPYINPRNGKLSEITAGEMDSLLTGLKSNWLSWDKILSDEIPDFRYKQERQEHFIEGILLTDNQQLGFPGDRIIMSVPGKVARFRYAVTDYEAKFIFPVSTDENNLDLILQPVDTGRNYRIFMESSFPERYFPSQKVTDQVSVTGIPSVSSLSLNYQVGKIFGSVNTGEIALPVTEIKTPKRFYGKPDLELVMKDYIKLPTMEEVFYELVPHVRIVKSGKEYEIAFLDFNGSRLYEEPPVLMIDGVIFNNASVIARLDPEAVERIDVIRGIYHVGGFAFHGIVNVITNAGNFIRLPLPEYASRIAYRICEPALTFVSPDYSDPEIRNSRNPDLRNTLYWNPSVIPADDGTATVEFWSSDISSDYLVDVKSVSAGGKIVSLCKVIKIRQ